VQITCDNEYSSSGAGLASTVEHHPRHHAVTRPIDAALLLKLRELKKALLERIQVDARGRRAIRNNTTDSKTKLKSSASC
jgi:hypothetical protein